MAGLTARLVSKFQFQSADDLQDEKLVTTVLVNTLREVDPLTVIDGVEFLDEHEILQQEEN